MEPCKICDWVFEEGAPIKLIGDVSNVFFEVVLRCRICKCVLLGCLTRQEGRS